MPVEQVGTLTGRLNTNTLGPFSGQNAQADVGRVLDSGCETEDPTADDAAADIGVHVTVDWRVRRLGQLLKYVRGSQGSARTVLEHVDVINQGLLRKAG